MIHSPPALAPDTQEPAVDFDAAGMQASNEALPAIVSVVNATWNGPLRVRRRTAEYYLFQGRAERVGTNAIRLIYGDRRNKAAAACDRRVYDSIDAGFEWARGSSDGCAVMKATRGTSMARGARSGAKS